MIKVKFTETVFGEQVRVFAKAKDVDSYGAVGLKLSFQNKNGEPIELPFDRDTYEDLSEKASELLYERKYEQELEF